MRTTLTLDEDVYRKLESETRRTGRSFKEVVNEHLRRSLVAAKPAARRNPFRVNARSMGARPGVDLSNIQQLLDELDGPARR
jgi:predicted CopG family antitoxin